MTSILFGIVRISRPQFKCNYLYIQKFFLFVFSHFWNLHQILNILKKKMIFIATLFRKLQTVKDLFRTLSKKHPLMTVNMLNGSQTLAKRAWEHIYHIFSSLRENLIWKTSPSVICEILGVFPNTLTANEKYPIWYCENLLSQMGMQLSL